MYLSLSVDLESKEASVSLLTSMAVAPAHLISMDVDSCCADESGHALRIQLLHLVFIKMETGS